MVIVLVLTPQINFVCSIILYKWNYIVSHSDLKCIIEKHEMMHDLVIQANLRNNLIHV